MIEDTVDFSLFITGKCIFPKVSGLVG